MGPGHEWKEMCYKKKDPICESDIIGAIMRHRSTYYIAKVLELGPSVS